MAEYDDILVPTDGSKGSAQTLEHAVSIGRAHDATIHALYVIDQRRYLAASKDTQDELVQSLEEEGEVALDDAAVAADEAGLEVETEMRQGIPHKEILNAIEADGLDLVVMGTHGRTGRDRVANLGSVAERVVGNIDVPVMVVNIE
jgi:nucleotide-binding universal stress UspA family protein